MTKNILKELIISLLLCVAIILVLGILFYEYVPMTKTIPNPVSYQTPDNIKQELAETQDVDESEIILTYEVDATDLNNYKRIQNYKPGKANPFSSYETTEINGNNTTPNNSSTEGNTTSSSENNTSGNNVTSGEQTEGNTNTSGGRLFPDKGIK